MEFNIAVLGGDGIGPEVTDQGVRALEAVGRAFGHSFNLSYGDIGGISIDKHGIPSNRRDQGPLGFQRCGAFRRRRRPQMGLS